MLKATRPQDAGRIDLRSGDVWPHPPIQDAQETGDLDDEDADDETSGGLRVESHGSRASYRDMELLITEAPGSP